MNSNLDQENQKNNIWPVSIAPMMKWTDRHYRYFMRQITKCTLLYTEMISGGAVLHGNREKLLGFSVEEKPLALQIGGDDPRELAECAQIVENYGYDEINLNVGCPSERVQKGNFGACLMAEPELVRDCLKAMKDAVSIPVTVKQRIGLRPRRGIDGQESYDSLARFVEIVAESGCDRFIVHSRIAVLKGLSPKDNRSGQNIDDLLGIDLFRADLQPDPASSLLGDFSKLGGRPGVQPQIVYNGYIPPERF